MYSIWVKYDAEQLKNIMRTLEIIVEVKSDISSIQIGHQAINLQMKDMAKADMLAEELSMYATVSLSKSYR